MVGTRLILDSITFGYYAIDVRVVRLYNEQALHTLVGEKYLGKAAPGLKQALRICPRGLNVHSVAAVAATTTTGA